MGRDTSSTGKVAASAVAAAVATTAADALAQDGETLQERLRDGVGRPELTTDLTGKYHSGEPLWEFHPNASGGGAGGGASAGDGAHGGGVPDGTGGNNLGWYPFS